MGHTGREPDTTLLRCARRWANVTITLQRVLVLHLGTLDGDSLVHHGGKVGEIMNGKSEPEVWVEATTELLLPASISGDLLFRIAREVEELALIGFNSHVALSEVAEFFRLTLHDSLRNVAGAKGRLKFIPSDDFSNWQGTLVGAPPLSSGAFQVIRRKVHIVGWIDISRLQLVSDVTKPVISIQRLNSVAEHSGVEAGEVVQSHGDMVMVVPILIRLGELSHDILYELTVQLELLHHRGHVIWRRRWVVGTTTHPRPRPPRPAILLELNTGVSTMK